MPRAPKADISHHAKRQACLSCRPVCLRPKRHRTGLEGFIKGVNEALAVGGDFTAVMKAFGFRGTRETYRLGTPGEAQVLFDVQRGRPPASGSFFVNEGISSQEWLDFRAWDMGIDSVGDLKIGGLILHNRL